MLRDYRHDLQGSFPGQAEVELKVTPHSFVIHLLPVVGHGPCPITSVFSVFFLVYSR